jgi:hypothetical protein
MLASGGGFNESLLNSHKWWGIAVAFFATLAWLIRITDAINRKAWEKVYRLALSVAVVSLLAAGYFGGALAHGQDYLTSYMPGPLKAALGIEIDESITFAGNLDEAVIFADLVFPIFNARCASCHDPDKSEGDLRLDSFEHLMSGGESGPVIVDGNPYESELFRRITLPRNHDDRMPPGGRRPLTEAQIGIIEWWILEGALPDLQVAEANQSSEIQTMLVTLAGGGERSGIPDFDVNPADMRAISQLSGTGILVTPVSEQHNFLRASFISIDEYEPGLIGSLEGISDQLAWLDLSHTPVADDDLEAISSLQSLTRLNLNATLLGDRGLAHLKSLHNLEHLSLVGTSVSDAGLEHLAELPGLRRLYVWQTGITEDGADWLRSQNPGLEIDLGHTLAEPDSIILPAETAEEYY